VEDPVEVLEIAFDNEVRRLDAEVELAAELRKELDIADEEGVEETLLATDAGPATLAAPLVEPSYTKWLCAFLT